ncbi:MAG: hypothetical protein A2V88_15340 [Elusimicrobia bacterium RBG_16_66_12]|nr:MAG: hypothetical protein A2V88_15340 [Elusimicrobia bacterium RBG_16_66_12]
MTITAKFASVCPCCNVRIQPGSKVEWTKGSKARHVACASRPGAVTVASAATQSPGYGIRSNRTSNGLGRRTGCSCGSQEGGSKSSDCWTCRHDAE